MTDKWKEFDEPHSDFDWDAPMWPCEVGYANKEHASNNAHRFIAARERSGGKLICSDDVVYSLGADNVWRAMTDSELMSEIRATDPEIVLDARKIVGMILEIKIARRTTARPFEWINEPNDAPAKNDLVLCGNGILDVRTMELRPLTPAYFATAIPEWDYDADATCPLWMQKLSEWLVPSYHPTLQEFTGYLLTPDTSLHAMLCLLGESRGGKGTVGRIQVALIGAAH